jgi:predicted RNA-binding protein with PIN domain
LLFPFCRVDSCSLFGIKFSNTNGVEMRKNRIILLDGYNVIRRIPQLQRQDKRSLDAGREMLARLCVDWKSRKPEISQLIIVFDGDSSVDALPGYQRGPGVKIVFTETGEKADSRILAIVRQSVPAAECTVVSDDGEVARGSKFLGAKAMSVSKFHDMLTARGKSSAQKTPPDAAKSSLSPTQEREITESLKKEWGIN